MTDILIVEDIAETRQWLAGLAREAFAGPHEVELAGTMRAAMAAIGRRAYEVALIDLGLPDGSGIDVLRALRHNNPEALCVVTTALGDDGHIVNALSAGANGYLLKEQPRELLVRQLSQLAQGVPALSPPIAIRIMEHFRLTGPVAGGEGDLTTREKDVLALISRGMRNVDVAGQLAMAESTVASHIRSIYRKLGISSRAEASWHAAQMGLAPGERGKS